MSQQFSFYNGAGPDDVSSIGKRHGSTIGSPSLGLWGDKLKNAEEVKKLTKLEMQYEFRTIQKELELEQKKEVLAKETEIKKQRFFRQAYFSGFLLMALLSMAI